MDPGRPQRPDDLRRDVRCFRPEARLGKTRCHHFLVAEGAWRRGRARHVDSFPSRRGAAGDLYAALAIAKTFPLTHGGKLIEAIFEGETINTPSLMCVEDYIDALNWGNSLGGLDALIARADANSYALGRWVERTPWVDFLAADP